MRTAYGVPVVERAEDLPRVVAELGIVPWRQVEPPADLETYRTRVVSAPISLDRLEEGSRRRKEQMRELEHFAPRSEAVFLETPSGKPFTGFRSVGRNWVSVFATVPDPSPDLSDVVRDKWWNWLVPVIAEWKHGAEVTVIGPPCGEPKSGESPKDAALREFREETGFELADAVQLAPEGLAVSARQTTQQYLPFLGTVKEPITRGEAKLDRTEDLKLVLVRLFAWVDFVLSGVARDDNAYAMTFLALNKMRLLQVGYPVGRGGITMEI